MMIRRADVALDVQNAMAEFLAAFRASGREQKVALLGLALVLAVLSWP